MRLLPARRPATLVFREAIAGPTLTGAAPAAAWFEVGPPAYLGRVGKSFRIDPRQGDAGRFADPGVTVVLLRLLERGDGILGLFAKLAKFEGGAAADVVALMPEGFDQRRNDLFRVALPRGKVRAAITPSFSLPDFRSAINSSVDFCLLQPPHASKQSNRTKPVCTRITQVLRLNRGEEQGEWPASAGLLAAAGVIPVQRRPVASPRLSRSLPQMISPPAMVIRY